MHHAQTQVKKEIKAEELKQGVIIITITEIKI
jgi:hypothetical protein